MSGGADPSGRVPIEWKDFPMPWKTHPDSRRVAASSLFSVVPINFRSSLPFAAQLRRPVAVRFVSAIPGRGAARCVTARRGSCHSRWPAIAATSPWLPCPVFPPAIPATLARLRRWVGLTSPVRHDVARLLTKAGTSDGTAAGVVFWLNAISISCASRMPFNSNTGSSGSICCFKTCFISLETSSRRSNRRYGVSGR